MANTELIAGAGFLEKRFTQGGTTEPPKIYKFEPPEGMGPVAWMDFNPLGQLVLHGDPREHVRRRVKEYVLVYPPNDYENGSLLWMVNENSYPSFFSPRASVLAINNGANGPLHGIAGGTWNIISELLFGEEGAFTKLDPFSDVPPIAVSDNRELAAVGYEGKLKIFDITRSLAREVETVEFEPEKDDDGYYRLDQIEGLQFIPNATDLIFSKNDCVFRFRPGFGEGSTFETTNPGDHIYGNKIKLIPGTNCILAQNIFGVKGASLDKKDRDGHFKTLGEFPQDWKKVGRRKKWSGQWSFDEYLRYRGFRDGFMGDPFDYCNNGFCVEDLAVCPDGKTVVLAGEQSLRFFSVDCLDLGIKPKEIGRLHFDHRVDNVAVNPVNGDVVYTEL